MKKFYLLSLLMVFGFGLKAQTLETPEDLGVSELEYAHIERVLEAPLTTKSLKANPIVSVNETDSLALVALYNATDGENWTDNSNWLTGRVSDWYGITINDEGRVTQIRLNGSSTTKFGLSGSIPAEIGNLTQLTSLDL
ncbi:MAG: hypothetical protein KAI79_03385, partial [Bacteroidales bacterium]|nr:hypothetical protein [Bacteroidales bacterium]